MYSAAFSPDGQMLVTGGYGGTAIIWDVATGLEIRRHTGDLMNESPVAFSPDGRWIISACSDHRWLKNIARICEVSTGREIRRFVGHTSIITSVAFSPDGKYVLTSADEEGTARLWDTATGSEIRRFLSPTKGILLAVFSPDGRSVLAGNADGTTTIWETATGIELRRYPGLSKKLDYIAISPDGQTIISFYEDGDVRLWDSKTGKGLGPLIEHSGQVTAADFSPNNRYLAIAEYLGTRWGISKNRVTVWDVRTGRKNWEFRIKAKYFSRIVDEHVGSIVFSMDSRFLFTGTPGGVGHLWDVTKQVEVQRYEGHSLIQSNLALSPDQSLLLAQSIGFEEGQDKTTVWDLRQGQCSRIFQSRSFVGWLPDKLQFLTDEGMVLDASTGETIEQFDNRNAKYLKVAPDGKRVLFQQTIATKGFAPIEHGPVYLQQTERGAVLYSFGKQTEDILSAIFSPDGNRLVTSAGTEGVAFLKYPTETFQSWDVTTGKLLAEYKEKVDRNFSGSKLAIQPGGRLVAIGIGKIFLPPPGSIPGAPDQQQYDRIRNANTLRLWDIETGKEVYRFADETESISALAFSRDGKILVTGKMDGSIRFWDVTNKKEVRLLSRHKGFIYKVEFSADDKWLWTASYDGTVRLWDLATGQEKCQLISFVDDTWAVVDPEGRYDASNGGDVQGLHWVVGNEPIALAQLKDRYYEPGLLAKILGFNKEPLREVSAFKDVKLFPSVEYDAPAPGSTKFNIKLTNRGGGIGKVRVLVNGKEVAADSRSVKTTPTATRTMAVDLVNAPVVAGKSNTIEVVAWNADGYLSSRPIKREWIPSGDTPIKAPELYAIVAGISKYASPDLSLHFAAKDAEDMAKALEVGAKRLFGAEKIHLSLLTTSNNPQAIAPTKTNFKKAFEAARNARPWDVFVVYLAGHAGTLETGNDTYCYLTAEGRMANFEDPAIRAQMVITSEELTEWIKQIPALKQVMILDTCQAGAAASRLIDKRDIPSDQIRAIERLKDRTGFHILMGSAADAVSYEASRYGQGLLTYSLLQGMRGAALRDGEYVDVSRLFQYAADQVPQLARNVGGIQKPVIAAPRGTSFDIGQLQRDDKAAIPLAFVMPMILRPVFLNPEQGFDNLDLMTLVRKGLQEESYAVARGDASAPLSVFVDADELPGAIRPSGTYTIEAETVRANLFLIRDGQRIANFLVEGMKADPSQLARRIAEAINENVKSQIAKPH